MPQSDDALFWHRMNHKSPEHDLPHMTSTPRRPRIPLLELHVSTSAGKPLLHFNYNPAAPDANTSSSQYARSSALCATAVAYQAATNNAVRVVRAPSGVLVSLVIDQFHITVSSKSRQTSPQLLLALARISVAILYTTLSTGFSAFLASHANADVAHHTRPAQKMLQTILLDAITYPLPYTLLKPVSLPCPMSPGSRSAVSHILRRALNRCPPMAHALIFSASPPYPRRIIATVSPSNAQLSPIDTLFLMTIPPLRADDTLRTPERLYLQSDDFSRASEVFLRLVQLRLDPDDYEIFRNAVGGSEWRPEWNGSSSDSVWVMGVARKGCDKNIGRDFLDCVEDSLDRASASRDVMVSMERPWTLKEIKVSIETEIRQNTKAVLLLEQRRIIGTMDSFGLDIGACIIETLMQWDGNQRDVDPIHALRSKNFIVVNFPCQKLRIVLWQRRFVVVFSDCISNERALRVCEKIYVPWLKRFASCLVPEQERATIPPRTPLAGILSPFHS